MIKNKFVSFAAKIKIYFFKLSKFLLLKLININIKNIEVQSDITI